MLAEILLLIVILELGLLIYLVFKLLPAESQKEVLRQIPAKPKSKLVEWIPLQDREADVFKEALKNIKE